VVALPNVDPVEQTHGTGFVLQGGRGFESGLPTTITGSRTATAEMAWLNIVLTVKWKEALALLMVVEMKYGRKVWAYTWTRGLLYTPLSFSFVTKKRTFAMWQTDEHHIPRPQQSTPQSGVLAEPSGTFLSPSVAARQGLRNLSHLPSRRQAIVDGCRVTMSLAWQSSWGRMATSDGRLQPFDNF